jgi:molybdopterin converting factor subunit 1
MIPSSFFGDTPPMNVLLFGAAREAFGSDGLTLPKSPATVGELRRLLAESPELAALAPRCAVAVNCEYADDAAAIPPGAEVALLPPVGGG